MSEQKVLYYTVAPVYDDIYKLNNPHIKCAVTGDTLRGGTEQVQFMAVSAHVLDGMIGSARSWNDRPDDFTVPVDAAHPCSPSNKDDDDRWDRNLRARELVNNRHSKNALINCIHWLLTRTERAEAALTQIDLTIGMMVVDDSRPDEIRVEDCADVIKGEAATQVIEFVKALQLLARMGLGKTFEPSKAKKAA